MGRSRLLDVCAVLLSVSAVAASSALAQNTHSQSSVPTAQQLNPAALTPPPSRARSNDIFAAPEPGPCPLRDSPLTFTLREVRFDAPEGKDLDQRLEESYRDLIGKAIPVSMICDIRDRAAAILFSAGILARVEIPEQRIAGGQLQLTVVEARIASINFHGDAGPAEDKVEGYLEQLRGLTPFNLNVAQRYLLLAADVPGVQISAAIRPSPQGRGAVDLDVTISRKVVDAAVNVQNFGSRTLGPWAGLARVDFNGLTSLGDRTSVVLYETSDAREQHVAQLLEDIRPGDDGLLLHGSVSYSDTHPGGNLASLRLSGTAIDAVLSAAYPLIRKQHENLNLIGGLEYVDEKTGFPTGPALFDDRIRVLFGRVSGDARGFVLGRPWQAGGDIELRKGLDVLDASKSGQVNLSTNKANPDAFVQRLDGHASLDPIPKLELYVAGAAQYTDASLVTFEQLAVGNLTYGRGYDPSSVAGDRGLDGTVEARVGPFAPIPNLLVSGYAFFDAAYVRYVISANAAGANNTVTSTGFGLRFTYLNRYDLDVGYADPLDKIRTTDSQRPPARVLVTVSARY